MKFSVVDTTKGLSRAYYGFQNLCWLIMWLEMLTRNARRGVVSPQSTGAWTDTAGEKNLIGGKFQKTTV